MIIQPQMLMCHKVTHKYDWQPPAIPYILFLLGRIEKTSLIQYNYKSRRFFYEAENTYCRR